MTDQEQYPDNVIEKLKDEVENIKVFNASEIAEELGNIRAQNIVLLGALIKALELDNINWTDVLKENLPERFHELNIKALKTGMDK